MVVEASDRKSSTSGAISRGERLRDSMLSKAPRMCAERAGVYTAVYRDNKADSVIVKRSKALKKHIETMTIYIEQDELIVGNQAATPRSAPVYPETEARYILAEGLDSFDGRQYDPFVVSDEVKQTLAQVLPLWEGHTVEDIASTRIPEETFRLMEHIPYKVFHPEIHFRGGIGHVSGGFERVLERGFDGLRAEAEERLAQLDMSLPESFEKQDFYKAAITTCEGVMRFAERFAELAREMATQEEDETRKMELDRIAVVCHRVPAKPARNYYEALQAIWFSHLLLQIESNGLGASPGRIDQYLYQYYRRDMEE